MHALAFSGLGSAYAMSYIHTSSPENLRLARQNLDRAIELDGELGEPYPFLCYIYYRLGESKRALEMGEKGVKLQSDLAQAHYFYGAVQFMALELGLGNCQRAIDSMTVAIRLDPRAGSQWMIAGSAALCRSQYSTAQRLFERALRLETNPNVPRRFVGASCMLGFVYSRQLAWEDARRCHLNSIESMRGIEHVYRDVVISLSACGLGEIELRLGHPEESLARFRHAWRLVKEEARMIGNRRIGIRAQVGMAAAYARSGDREKAGWHLAEALSRLPSVEPGSWIFDTSFAELHYAIACAQLGLNLIEEAVASLSSAVDTGFSDIAWLQADPEWKPLHTKHQYRELVERMRLIPQVTIDIDSFPADTPISSSAIQA
jgi:tetratricopeptide (TPR) repeat protein